VDKAARDRLARHLATLPLEQRKVVLDQIQGYVPPVRRTKYMPPTLSFKQEAFLRAPNLEILYGGAAGGGKTAGMLAAALQYADQPNYDALIIRRTHAELEMPGATISLAKRWLGGSDAAWVKGNHYEFPLGATLNFGYLSRDDDKWQYQSANYNFIGIDEAAEFPNEDTYKFLFSRLRRGAEIKIPSRMRLGANPIGPGANWLKRRFITCPFDPALAEEPCEVCQHYHWKDHCDAEKCDCPYNPNSEPRLYIPARLEDNPFLDKIAYKRSLSNLDPYTRVALESGDWNAKPPGKMFRREWFIPVPGGPADPFTARVRFWDLAATAEDKNKNPSYTCGAKLSYHNGLYTVEHVVRKRATPGDVKDLVKTTAYADGPSVAIWIEQEPGSSGIAVIADYIRFLPQFVVRPFKATGEKTVRAAPFASQCEAKNVRMVTAPWNEPYLEEMEQFPSGTVKNDQVDASSGAYNVLVNYPDFSAIASYGERTKPDWNFG
jgi:predicted phage terminase large subunit-like protein